MSGNIFGNCYDIQTDVLLLLVKVISFILLFKEADNEEVREKTASSSAP